MSVGNKQVRLGCGALIVDENDDVLLLLRAVKSRTEFGYWSQPGGGVDYGETVEQAIIREIQEELGLKIKLLEYLCFTDLNYGEGIEHWVSISYLARIKKGTERNMEPDKHSEMEWFNMKNLPKKTTKSTRESIRAYLASR